MASKKTTKKPAAEEKRQRYLLLALGALLLFLGYRQVGGLFGGGNDGFLGGMSNADFSSLLDTEVEGLALSRLDAVAQEVEVGRNPWKYGRKPIPPPTPSRPRPEPPVVVKRPVVTQTPTGPPKPVPPAIDVEFLGSLGTEIRKVAVFIKDDLVINALVGDVVSEKFRVHAIGLESVDLTFEGFPDTPPERLPLKEKN